MNVCSALPKEPSPLMFAWLDSTVALHWIVGNGTYKQFVTNRVAKIQSHPSINWRYVPTLDNPADIASRGGLVSSLPIWWSGPEWLQDPTAWPDNPVTQRTAASDAEAKAVREVLCVTKSTKPDPDVPRSLEAPTKPERRTSQSLPAACPELSTWNCYVTSRQIHLSCV